MQDKVFHLLKESPEPLSARDIASKLRSTKTEVNVVLYSFLNQGLVQKVCHTGDSPPFWSVLPGASEFQREVQPFPRRQARLSQPRIKLTTEPPLYRWQEEAFGKWRGAGYRGVLEAVTGSGKTRFALEAARRLRDTTDQCLYTLIVVPTITLMDQWYNEALDFRSEEHTSELQ